MRTLLLHSPSAGDDGPSQDDLLEIFRQAGCEPFSCAVNGTDFSDVLCRPADLVVAVGGDGTVTRVLTHLPDRSIPVAIVPQGTANNIADALGIAGDPAEIAAALGNMVPRPFDIGFAKGPWGHHRFIEAVGMGLLARAMAEVDEAGVAGEEQIRTSRETFRQKVAEGASEHLKAIVDGRTLEGDFLVFEVMNIGQTGPDLTLAPDADPGDGLLDVVHMPADRRAEMLEWLDGGPDVAMPPLDVIRGREVEIVWAGKSLRLGDNFSPAPGVVGRVSIGLEPEQVRILVPASAARGAAADKPGRTP
ncbi:NAD(+)/NADH kinase [Skermanella rosea]|uniref:diacylglycerol/lipid kinase family protein n=1 Tax=Skermanella rosea TaxID=1817965 RepID=UPI0019342B20|nr:diacylglycerol kinase family protein [Skermanella rosea]UEM02559.1 NAD(+)/NADH kinase [Skermanella rosea]